MATKNFINLLFGNEYYTLEDLRYNQKLGLMFSKEQLKEYTLNKEQLIEEGNPFVKKLPLKTFNSKYFFYVKGQYLLTKSMEYLTAFVDDINEKSSTLFERNADDILTSRLFSEIEGTLNIENVPTTHKRIKEVFSNENITDKNDVILKNMQNAVNFIVNEKPKFTKENLLKLYNLLSNDCLEPEKVLKDGQFYRDDLVTIGGFDGAPVEQIDELMDSLFEFANDKKNVNEYGILFPHICHYYILYVHPYFDYNGRTARMVSFWLNSIYNITLVPLYISEAINESKKNYYRALTQTRIMENDLTYFLGYILEASIRFNFVYKNLEEIKNILAKKGDFLTSTELTYLKKVIAHNPEDYFNYKMFFEYINGTMSKQAGLKFLNHLVDYGVLIKATNKKKEAIFKVNQEFITYKYIK